MDPYPQTTPESTLVFDALDLDLVVKVLSHTIFSPFFVALIPVFLVFHGAKYTDPPILISGAYYLAISTFWFTKWCSKLWRNQGGLFFRPSRLDWGEQIVLITGGSSGVGELLANTLAIRNVAVVVLDVHPIITENQSISYYECDVSKWDQVKAVSDKVIAEIGNPTIIVNNAGVVQGKLIMDLTPEDVNQTFGVNTLAHFWILKAFLPAMLKEKFGHIVTVSSVMGTVSCAQMIDYNASKAAALSLHESLRYELDKRYKTPKIRTTIVLPGHILTPMFSRMSLPSSWFYRFFFPSIPPIVVVKGIIAALDEQYSTVVLAPLYTHLAPFIKFLPSFIRDMCQWISGADYAMDGFIKVTGRRPEEGLVPDCASNRQRED